MVGGRFKLCNPPPSSLRKLLRDGPVTFMYEFFAERRMEAREVVGGRRRGREVSWRSHFLKWEVMRAEGRGRENTSMGA